VIDSPSASTPVTRRRWCCSALPMPSSRPTTVTPSATNNITSTATGTSCMPA